MLALGLIGMLVIWLTIAPSLPSVESLRDVRLQVPLRVYSADDQLMAEIGEQRRLPIRLDDMPEQLKLAFLAAEDDRFYSHPGIDWRGTARGVWLYARSMGRGRVPGGSTITQQVARRFFLSTDYSITRKLREILLAVKIEREMSKDEIFELYLNKEFLGHRAYGVGAAAQVYYGKTLDELTLAESAMIAALPKAPSRDNPLSGPRQAMIRRNWILDRMYRLGYIDEQAHAEARSEPNSARYHGPVVALNAPWISEMVRREVVGRLGADEAYSGGYSAWTTVDSRLQRAADRAVRDGLQAYDRRHGWRGAERRLDDATMSDPDAMAEELERTRAVADLLPAVVMSADEERAELLLRGGDTVELQLEDVTWARAFVSPDAIGGRPNAVTDVINTGDLVRLRHVGETWRLAQIPQAEAALVSMDAETGAIVALVGGLDFGRNQFNRVTQSRRQPGSAFKPFIYAAALDHGFTAASVVNDAPVVVDDPSMERAWRPTNFSRRFHGPTRLREAMIHSRNLVSVRLLMDMGLDYARDYISDFGFDYNELPNGPSMALGSASLTPLSVTAAYAVFANGGYGVKPQYLYSVTDGNGQIVMEPEWRRLCRDCPEIPPAPEPVLVEESHNDRSPALRRLDLNGDRADRTDLEDNPALPGPPRPTHAERVIQPQTAWLIDSMMADVITSGTGRRALNLNRNDLAGKTGTTNDLRDTWFAGYGGGLVTTVWLGMDDNQTLGRQEQGGRTALPLWVDFMAVALEDRPEYRQPTPVGLAQALINPETGRRTRPGTSGALQEWFHADNLPPLEESRDSRNDADPYDIF
jgi:penicillin-binding protein 1A